MTHDFLADTVLDAIARGVELHGLPLYGIHEERDGKLVIGIASEPDFWLHIADALYLVGQTDAPNAATYRALNDAICSHFGIGRVE